ncbi:MAG: flagellar hook-length control protein FliK [bacterium]
MAIENLIDTVKFDSNTKNNEYTQKNYSKDNSNGFLNIFESTNKSFNFSFDKTEKFSQKNLNQYSKNLNLKGFKSDYENFHNKLADNKNIDNSIKKEVFFKLKEEKKDADIEAKDTVSETKENQKDAVSEVKEETTSLNQQENNNTETVAENINLNQQEQIQTALQNTDEANVSLPKNNTAELKTANLEKTLPEELTTLQKQIANEKITNKQAENVLQQKSTDVEEETSKDQQQINKINLEELKKTDTKIIDQTVKQDQSKKPEILASEDVLNKLNAIDKTQIKQPHSENLKPVSEKLADTINNEDAKPVITNIQVQTNSSKQDSDGQNQKQNQQELKSNISQVQVISSDENNLQKIDLQKTSQFDKILNTKQTQTPENSVLNQLKDKISSDISTNKSQVSIVLRPDNLGKVNINLVSQNGVLTAQITAENTQVKDILTKGLETLRQNMAEQGINVGKMVVNVQESSSSNQNMNSEENQKNFEQANSNTSNMNYQSDKQKHSGESSSAYLNNASYEFNEESENETGDSVGENKVFHSGTVDYKI